MIICFNCESNTKEILDNLIKGGSYKNYNELINVAIENLSLLESEMKISGGIVIDIEHVKETKQVENESRGKFESTPEKEYIEKRFSINPEIPKNILIPKMPGVKWNKDQEIPVGNWFFGQYNRLLPAKISCRSIANHQKKEKNGVQINEIPIIVAKEALYFAKYLNQIEVKHNLSRDDLLTVALPSPDKDEEKSLLRFANQFVVSKNSDNQLQGLLYDLKFINYSTDDNNDKISLTQPGWEFAILQNPIMEDFQEYAAHKFSEEEKLFLIKHIKNNVPQENYAYRLILSELEKGENSPDNLDSAIKAKHLHMNEFISDSFLSTQRSGAISRMIDLDLVKRVREGIRVKYFSTDLGRAHFLS